jgi:hypothetical protein
LRIWIGVGVRLRFGHEEGDEVTDEWGHSVSGTRIKKAAGAHCALMGRPKAKEGGAARPSGRASVSSGPEENRPTAGLLGHQAEIAKVRVFPFYLFFYIFQSIFPIKF